MANHPNRPRKGETVSSRAGRNPTPAEIIAAREAAGLTQDQAGKLLYRGAAWWDEHERGTKHMWPALWDLFLLLSAPSDTAAAALLTDLRRQQRAGLGKP